MYIMSLHCFRDCGGRGARRRLQTLARPRVLQYCNTYMYVARTAEYVLQHCNTRGRTFLKDAQNTAAAHDSRPAPFLPLYFFGCIRSSGVVMAEDGAADGPARVPPPPPTGGSQPARKRRSDSDAPTVVKHPKIGSEGYGLGQFRDRDFPADGAMVLRTHFGMGPGWHFVKDRVDGLVVVAPAPAVETPASTSAAAVPAMTVPAARRAELVGLLQRIKGAAGVTNFGADPEDKPARLNCAQDGEWNDKVREARALAAKGVAVPKKSEEQGWAQRPLIHCIGSPVEVDGQLGYFVRVGLVQVVLATC